MKTWVVYSLLRLALFAAALTLLLLLNVPGWIAAIVAAIISFCISYLFFGRQRAKVAALLQKSRDSGQDDDDEYDADTLGVDPSARRRAEASDEASEDGSLDADPENASAENANPENADLKRDGGAER